MSSSSKSSNRKFRYNFNQCWRLPPYPPDYTAITPQKEVDSHLDRFASERRVLNGTGVEELM